MIDWLERVIVNTPPARRRRIALHALVWSVILMAGNVALYLAHIIDETGLILVTLILSWLAITLTAIDVIMTADVRANE